MKTRSDISTTPGFSTRMDLGIALSLESKSITGAGVMIGTPEYMSPEQVERKEVEPATYSD
jgi:serine/threonine protein kinase